MTVFGLPLGSLATGPKTTSFYLLRKSPNAVLDLPVQSVTIVHINGDYSKPRFDHRRVVTTSVTKTHRHCSNRLCNKNMNMSPICG